MTTLSGKTAIVVGASRGLGGGIATASRMQALTSSPSRAPIAGNGSRDDPLEIADAADATVPASLFDRYEPDVVVLVAGAGAAHAPVAASRPGRRSPSTGRRTSGSRSTGCARRCSRRSAGRPGDRVQQRRRGKPRRRRSAAATPARRRPSA